MWYKKNSYLFKNRLESLQTKNKLFKLKYVRRLWKLCTQSSTRVNAAICTVILQRPGLRDNSLHAIRISLNIFLLMMRSLLQEKLYENTRHVCVALPRKTNESRRVSNVVLE